MLAARRAPGAELGAHRQRHLRRATGHEGQLGRLVEQLVEADADEVEVHQLDHGVHAGHGRPDTEPDDRGLGDRRVVHPPREFAGQAPGEPEDVAAGADVDAGDEDTVVFGELGGEGRADGVHGAEHGSVGGRRGRLGPRRRARTTKSIMVAGDGLASRRAASTAPSSVAAVDASRALSSSSLTPACRSAASCTNRGSRARHSSTSSADR